MGLFFNAVILYINRYYYDVWLNENVSWQVPHQDEEIYYETSVWRDTIPTPKKNGRWAQSILDFRALWVLLSI